jgi:hypothetical protein
MPGLPKIEDLTIGQQRELAEAYLDLLTTMNAALDACETGYGFFSWNGKGYAITGHPPHDLVERLVEAAKGEEH